MFQRRMKHATTDVPSFGSTACRYTEYETVSSKVRRNKSLIVKLQKQKLSYSASQNIYNILQKYKCFKIHPISTSLCLHIFFHVQIFRIGSHFQKLTSSSQGRSWFQIVTKRPAVLPQIFRNFPCSLPEHSGQYLNQATNPSFHVLSNSVFITKKPINIGQIKHLFIKPTFRLVLSHPQTVQEFITSKYTTMYVILLRIYIYFVKIIIFKSCNCLKFYVNTNQLVVTFVLIFFFLVMKGPAADATDVPQP